MIDVVTSWTGFREKWHARQNFLLAGDLFPFRFNSPPLAEVIEAVRQNERSRIVTGRPADRSEATSTTSSTYLDFRDLPIEEALHARVQMSHFELNEFTGPGQIFQGLGETIEGWYAALTSHGFSWSSSERAMFMSGPQSHTNYHFDSSYVLAWQIHGRKRFCFTKDPEHWCNADVRRLQADRYNLMTRPPGLGPNDIVEVEMKPGDVLWNVMLTPHWVYSLEESAYSFNITHWGLRCDGELSPIDGELSEIRRERETAGTAT
jgi:hypothetical protein